MKYEYSFIKAMSGLLSVLHEGLVALWSFWTWAIRDSFHLCLPFLVLFLPFSIISIHFYSFLVQSFASVESWTGHRTQMPWGAFWTQSVLDLLWLVSKGGLWHWQVRTQHKRIQFNDPTNQCTSKLCQLYLSSLFEMIPPLCSRGVEVWSFQFFVLHLDLEIWDLMSFSMITSTPQDLPPNGLASLEFVSMAFHGGIQLHICLRLSAFWIHWASYVHSWCTSH